MKNKIFTGIVVVAVLVIIVVSRLPSQNTSEGPLKIGLALPLTGPVAFLGESAKQAAQMALEDAGQTKYEYNLIFEDDSFSPAKTATVASKFVNVDKVLAMITFGSATSNAAAPITENAKVIRFGLASDPTSANGEYNFIHWTPAYKEGELISKEISVRGYKTVSIVDVNHSGPMAVTSAVKSSLEKYPIELLSYDLTNVGDKDFRSTIVKINKLNPDIVVVSLFSPEIELFAKQAKELGARFQLTSAETFEWSNEPKLFEGLWFVGDSSVPEAFTNRFTTKYGHNPKAGSAYIYDLVALLIKYQEGSNTRLNSTDLVNRINKDGSYESPLFDNVRIDNDGMFVTEASLKIMRNGQAEFVK